MKGFLFCQVSKEIQHEVQQVVDEAIGDMNMTQGSLVLKRLNSTFRDQLVKALDADIEKKSLYTLMTNYSGQFLRECAGQ